ncbi:MAG: DUF4910 domain-containing protein [Granulosicoccus sp.]
MNGRTLHQLLARLFPLARSITGPGVRETLRQLQAIAPLEIKAVPSGAQVLDWEVPEEWHFRNAWIADNTGKRIIDAANTNLHVVNFSTAVDKHLSLQELKPHLHSLPDRPEAIPYRTSYYERQWAFCLAHQTVLALENGDFGNGPFHVHIDTEHLRGELNWGELVIPGKSSDEILVSTHVCHPSLANDNLSGLVLAAALAAERLQQKNPHTWRFLFVPGTIGAISWLAANQATMPNIVGGLVLTGLGDDSPFTWKDTRQGDAWIDRIVMQVLREQQPGQHSRLPFGPYGYDERQYASPGFKLPVGRLTRAVHGTFPEYHTSDDNLDFVTPECLEESLNLLKSIATLIDTDGFYQNLAPYGEPQLGQRGLYGKIGAQRDPGQMQMAMLWMLNQSDGFNSLLDIAEKSAVNSETLHHAACMLEQHKLLKRT